LKVVLSLGWCCCCPGADGQVTSTSATVFGQQLIGCLMHGSPGLGWKHSLGHSDFDEAERLGRIDFDAYIRALLAESVLNGARASQSSVGSEPKNNSQIAISTEYQSADLDSSRSSLLSTAVDETGAAHRSVLTPGCLHRIESGTEFKLTPASPVLTKRHIRPLNLANAPFTALEIHQSAPATVYATWSERGATLKAQQTRRSMSEVVAGLVSTQSTVPTTRSTLPTRCPSASSSMEAPVRTCVLVRSLAEEPSFKYNPATHATRPENSTLPMISAGSLIELPRSLCPTPRLGTCPTPRWQSCAPKDNLAEDTGVKSAASQSTPPPSTPRTRNCLTPPGSGTPDAPLRTFTSSREAAVSPPSVQGADMRTESRGRWNWNDLSQVAESPNMQEQM